MVKIEGTYKLVKNENLDDYFRAVGVPFIARTMMLHSSPTIHVSKEVDEDDADGGETWVFKTVTFFRTVTLCFKLNETYDETMPSGDVLESITTREGENHFITKSKHERIGETERIYDFSDEELVITLKHSSKGVQAKRYFSRVQE